MVVLKSTGQKVLRVDRSGSSTVTKETDSAGGSREITESQSEESTVLPQSGGGSNGPVVEKELCPEISGIVVSADGGGVRRSVLKFPRQWKHYWGFRHIRLKY